MLWFQSESELNDFAFRGCSHVVAKELDQWRALVRECISKARINFFEGFLDKIKLFSCGSEGSAACNNAMPHTKCFVSCCASACCKLMSPVIAGAPSAWRCLFFVGVSLVGV